MGLPRQPHQPRHLYRLPFPGEKGLEDLSQGSGARVCFFGHTHRRALWYRDIRGKVAFQDLAPQVQLSREGHYLINPGSVGQPRDGNPEAAYAIFDDEEFSIQFKSAPYDVAGAQQRILPPGCRPTWRSAWPWGSEQ